jgi:RNA polymerase sigma factor (sigma-70 family)
MHERADHIAGVLLIMERDLKREFETRLAETSTLAFRVAFAVLRNSEDAEDIAQESFAKAYRNFRQLRDRDRFRAWLVRMTWRMAISRLRSDRRRAVREFVPIELPKVETPVQKVIERERAEKLWRAIDALPEKLRLVVVLALRCGNRLVLKRRQRRRLFRSGLPSVRLRKTERRQPGLLIAASETAALRRFLNGPLVQLPAGFSEPAAMELQLREIDISSLSPMIEGKGDL